MGNGSTSGLTTDEPFGYFVYWAVTRHPKSAFSDPAVDRLIRAEFPDRHLALGGTGTYQPVPLQRSYVKNQPERLGIKSEVHADEVLARIDGKIRGDREAELDPTEVSTPALYVEGAVRSICVNAYERNPKARQACISHYGYDCAVCEFDFASFYGTIGEDFIHVHHLRDLAAIGEEYEVDPIQDLRPVCPNCHAMLHSRKPAMSISELRSIISDRGSRSFR